MRRQRQSPGSFAPDQLWLSSATTIRASTTPTAVSGLPAVLTDRVASARCLPDVLAWRLWRLLRASRQSDTAL